MWACMAHTMHAHLPWRRSEMMRSPWTEAEPCSDSVCSRPWGPGQGCSAVAAAGMQRACFGVGSAAVKQFLNATKMPRGTQKAEKQVGLLFRILKLNMQPHTMRISHPAVSHGPMHATCAHSRNRPRMQARGRIKLLQGEWLAAALILFGFARGALREDLPGEGAQSWGLQDWRLPSGLSDCCSQPAM